MKLQVRQVFLGVLAGAALVSVLTVVCPDPRAVPDRSSDVVNAIQALHEDVVREAAALRRLMADAGIMAEDQASGTQRLPTPGRETVNAVMESSPSEPRADALSRLGDWGSSPETRRSWLFASEATVLREFGVPDAVNRIDTAEIWVYQDRREGEIVGQLLLIMSRGRLIDVD